MNEINELPNPQLGTFACLNALATGSQAKEPKFLPTHHNDVR
jgi:hypothetical protein